MKASILLGALMVSALSLAQAATPAKAPVKPAKPAVTAPFGLTQALAVLYTCPDARFEGDSMMALGGVLQENQARIAAVPVEKRMDVMNLLVAEESTKAQQYAKTHPMDCASSKEPAAAYWNRLIERMDKDQKAQAAQKPSVGVAKPQPLKPEPKPSAAPVTLP